MNSVRAQYPNASDFLSVIISGSGSELESVVEMGLYVEMESGLAVGSACEVGSVVRMRAELEMESRFEMGLVVESGTGVDEEL
jgi:hypothetical protein